MGSLGSYVGCSIGWPWYLHLPWRSSAGLRRAWSGAPRLVEGETGAHEVVNTIMMNWTHSA
jgi:ABC-type uncharacterized transport system permease subunit